MLSVDMLSVIMLHVDKLLILAVLSLSKETVIMGGVSLYPLLWRHMVSHEVAA
jgi:hypothetical protein